MAATYRKRGWIQTYTGKQFYPLSPRPEDIDIVDIAHALSHQGRFSGHTREFYSVADHSVRVSEVCDPKDALWGLLHDAPEAYLVDLPRPLKEIPKFGDLYKRYESGLMRAICRKFNLPYVMPFSVEEADTMLLVTEARDLMFPLHPDWIFRAENGFPVLEQEIIPRSPKDAKWAFLDRFNELVKGKA